MERQLQNTLSSKEIAQQGIVKAASILISAGFKIEESLDQNQVITLRRKPTEKVTFNIVDNLICCSTTDDLLPFDTRFRDEVRTIISAGSDEFTVEFFN